MKFPSPDYQPHNYPRTNSMKYPKDEFSPKVKIPNYTTSSYGPTAKKPHKQSPQNIVDKLPNKATYSNNYSNQKANHQYSTYQYDKHYNDPVGVPLMPLYGYDNHQDAEKDWLYFRQLHPNTAKRILQEIDEECDKLEYDGSCMFDEYPDKVYLGRMIDSIYKRMKDLIEEPIIYVENLQPDMDCRGETSEVDGESKSSAQEMNRRRSSPSPIRSNNWLRDLIEILLYQEILNRRRRYRSRRRWF